MQSNIAEIIKVQRKNSIIVTAAGIIGGAVVNLTGTTGDQSILFKLIIIAGLGLLAYYLFLTFFKKNAPIRSILIYLLICAELIICTEGILAALNGSVQSIFIISSNMTTLAFILFVSIVAYLHYLTYIFAAVTMITYACAAYITKSSNLWELYFVFVVLYGAGTFLGYMLTKSMNKIIKENQKLQENTQKVLKSMNLSKDEFEEYMELAKKMK